MAISDKTIERCTAAVPGGDVRHLMNTRASQKEGEIQLQARISKNIAHFKY
jgi:hypothetical protein